MGWSPSGSCTRTSPVFHFGDVPAMADFVGAARRAASEELALMVDANQGWPVDIVDEAPRWDVELAASFAKAVEPYALRWLDNANDGRSPFERLSTASSTRSKHLRSRAVSGNHPSIWASSGHGWCVKTFQVCFISEQRIQDNRHA
jgi:hypothetical protein